MSLADLKLACAAQGLPKTGTKAKLINFLEHPELYAKPVKKQKTVAPAPADKPLAKPPAKPLVDRAARPTRATGGDAIINVADDDDGAEGKNWSNDAVSLYWTREDVVTEQEDPNDRFVGRKQRTLTFSGAVKTRVLPCELQNVLARELGAPGLFLGETKCVKCGALEYVARPGDVNELQDVLSMEAFLTEAMDAAELAGPAGKGCVMTADRAAVTCCRGGHVRGTASAPLKKMGTLGWGVEIPLGFACLW